MKKEKTVRIDTDTTKKGYNEKNPGQPQGAFAPASTAHKSKKTETKSNAAGKKAKEDQN